MPKSKDREGLPYLPSVGRLLAFANRAANELSERRLASQGLTLQQWILLTALWRNDGMTIGHLAAYCRVKEPTVSGLVDRMESKGLVLRRQPIEDRRKVLVFLTGKGKAYSHLVRFYEEINTAVLDGLTDAERASFISLMERVIKNLENELEKTAPRGK